MTIEEELMQRPRRSAGGFGGVAPDFDKMLADAMYEYDMRRQGLTARAVDLTDEDRKKGYIARTEFTGPGPRLIPGTDQVVYDKPPDPDLLRREILDPVYQAANAFQGRSTRPVAAKEADNRLLKSGQDYLQRDPVTGELTVAYKAPRIDNKARDFELDQISKQIQGLAALKYDPAKAAMAGLDATKIDAEIKRLNTDARKLLTGGDAIEEALTAQPAPVAPAPTPMIAIGEKGTQLSPAGPMKPGERGRREVTKPLKNGRKAVFDEATKEFIRYAD